MRGLTGYATLTDRLTGDVTRERDTFTCGHCQRIVHVGPKTSLDDLGGRCGVCDTLICGDCVKTGRCDPFEEKLRRAEHRSMVRRAYGLVALALAVIFSPAPARADFEFSDIACETTNTSGTGTVDLDGALTGGYLGFLAAGIDSGDTVPYHIKNGSQLETGIGTFTDGTPDTLSRTAFLSTDGSGAELTLSGTSTICVGPTTQTLVGGVTLLNVDTVTANDVTTTDDLQVGDDFLIPNANSIFNFGSGDCMLTYTAGTLAVTGSCAISNDSTLSGTIVTASTQLEVSHATQNTIACASGECTIEGDKIKQAGRQTIPLVAGAGTLPSGGAIAACTAVSAFDSGTNDVFMRQCSFSASADNAIYYTFFFPKGASETTDLVAQLDWTSATTTDATDDVIWTASAVCFSNDDAINGNAFPAVDTVTDTQTAAGDYLVSGEITAITPAGTPAEGDACVIRFTRDADAAGDNFNGTADLIQARLYYTDSGANDD